MLEHNVFRERIADFETAHLDCMYGGWENVRRAGIEACNRHRHHRHWLSLSLIANVGLTRAVIGLEPLDDLHWTHTPQCFYASIYVVRVSLL